MSKPLLLFIGPCQSQSGYGLHAVDIVRSLIKLDNFDVKVWPIRWGATPLNYLIAGRDDDILSRLLQNPQLPKQPDISVQLTIPPEFQVVAKYNIGISAGIETTICNPTWIEGLNRMDLNIVPSQHSKMVYEHSEFTKNDPNGKPLQILKNTKPLEVLFEGADINIYKRTEEISELVSAELNNIPDEFCFLYVGHWLQGGLGADRKDVGMLLKTFIETFKGQQSKPALILKTSSATFSLMDKEDIINKINGIKNMFSGQDIPNIYLLHGQLSDVEMNALYNHPKIKSMITLSHGEGFCVRGDTNIITTNGLKQIDSIDLSDKVLTHENRFKDVSSLMKRKYSGDMYSFDVFNGYSYEKTYFTPNHNILTYNKDLNTKTWKSSEEIVESDYLCFPKYNNNLVNEIEIWDYIKDCNNVVLKNKIIDYKHSDKSDRIHKIKSKIKLDKYFGKIIGYYLSEGCISNGSIIFCLHAKEKETVAAELIKSFNKVFSIKTYKITEIKNTNKLLIIFNSTIVSLFLKNFCGTYSYEKFINDIVFKSSKEFKSNILSSIIIGDGEIKQQGIALSLVNENLIKNIRLLLLEFSIISNFDFRNKNKMNAYSKIKHMHDVFRIRINKQSSVNKMLNIINKNHSFYNINKNVINENTKNFLSMEDDKYIYFKIKNIDKEYYEGLVYNISVAEDESYCLQNFVVHNCRPLLEFSLCGKPIISSAWSGMLDFLDKDLALLLSGALATVDPSAVNDFIIKDSQWFVANYEMVSTYLKEVYNNYNKYLSKSRKLMYQNKETFSLDGMQRKLGIILNKYLPEFPEEVQLKLPIKKISLPKLNRPSASLGV